MNLKLCAVIWISLILCISCMDDVHVKKQPDPAGITYITEWIAIGPFKTGADDPVRFDMHEARFHHADLQNLRARRIPVRKIDGHDTKINLFDFVENASDTCLSHFYLYTEIVSPEEKETVLILDGSCHYQVWVNQHECLVIRNKKNMQKCGDRFIRILLQKGVNAIFARVEKGPNKISWGLSAVLAPLSPAQDIYRKNYRTDFVCDPVIEDHLTIYTGPYQKGSVQILDDKNRKIENIEITGHLNTRSEMNFDTKELASGFYRCQLLLPEDTLVQWIYKGNILHEIDRFKKKGEKIHCDDDAGNDLKGMQARLDFLRASLDEKTEWERQYFHRNLVFWTRCYRRMLAFAEEHGHTRSFSGTMLKSYSCENQIYYFMAHINQPDLYEPVPVILFVPYALDNETLPASWYAGNLDQIAFDCSLADQAGYALVWLYMRGRFYTPECGIIDLKGTIERLKQDYRIDGSRVYVAGECVGGNRALLLAAACPDYFAGIAVSSPSIQIGFPEEEATTYIENLTHIPLCISHGIHDRTVPVQWSREFAERAIRNGQSVKLIETRDGHFHLARDERQFAFDFFSSLKSVSEPEAVTRFKYVTYYDMPLSAYWVEIVRKSPRRKAELVASYQADVNRMEIHTRHIDELNILAGRIGLNPDCRIFVDGKQVDPEIKNNKIRVEPAGSTALERVNNRSGL